MKTKKKNFPPGPEEQKAELRRKDERVRSEKKPLPITEDRNDASYMLQEMIKYEEALRSKEAEFSLILEAVPAMIAHLDTDCRYLHVNHHYTQAFGYTPEEIRGLHFRQVLGEVQWQEIKPQVEKVLSGQTVSYERQLTFPSGEIRWIRVSYTPVVAEDGRVRGFVVHIIDIEELRCAEVAIKTSEENYRRIIETANEGIVIGSLAIHSDITDRKKGELALRNSLENLDRAQEVGRMGWWRLDVTRNILTWSDETHRIFGIPKEAPMTYETFLETVHPDDRRFVDNQWAAALGGTNYDIEHRIMVNGEIKWVREKAYLEFDQASDLAGGFGITQDITEKKEAEEALRNSETRFRLLSETAGRLLAEKSPHQTLNELCRKVMEYLDCQVFFNFLVDEVVDRLRLNAYAGIQEEEAQKLEWRDYDSAFSGRAVRDKTPVVAEDIFNINDTRTDMLKSLGIHAYACHPLKVGNRVLGTLSFGTKHEPSSPTRILN
jgi:PAS domain S-box-containing protein